MRSVALLAGMALFGSCSADAPVASTPVASEPGMRPGMAMHRRTVSLLERFAVADDADLRELIVDDDTGLALAVGWERVDRTLHTEGDDAQATTQALSRFLGLVEGRVGFPVPEFWEAAVFGTEARGTMTYFVLDRRHSTAPGRPFQFEREGEQFRIFYGDESWLVPADRYSLFTDRVAGVISDDRVYVALYSLLPDIYPVHCVDITTGHTVWSAHVWASPLMNFNGGGFTHQAHVELTSDRVLIFGAGDYNIYIDAFDRGTGQPLWRFNSVYVAGGDLRGRYKRSE